MQKNHMCCPALLKLPGVPCLDIVARNTGVCIVHKKNETTKNIYFPEHIKKNRLRESEALFRAPYREDSVNIKSSLKSCKSASTSRTNLEYVTIMIDKHGVFTKTLKSLYLSFWFRISFSVYFWWQLTNKFF